MSHPIATILVEAVTVKSSCVVFASSGLIINLNRKSETSSFFGSSSQRVTFVTTAKSRKIKGKLITKIKNSKNSTPAGSHKKRSQFIV